jgi:hypothetical protein
MLLAAAEKSAPEVLGARTLRLRVSARPAAVFVQSLASGLALPLMGADALGHYADQPPGSRPRQTPHTKLGHSIGPAADVTAHGGAFEARPYLGRHPRRIHDRPPQKAHNWLGR